MLDKKTLVVLVGPTGVGKTALSLLLAKHFSTSIISADSRQFYKALKIGTATPDEKQLSQVQHYFIGNRQLSDNYSCGQYELDALAVLQQLFANKDVVLLVGGSMLYIDAVCNGIDDLPVVDPIVREQLQLIFQEKGADYLRAQLHLVDPIYYNKVDLKNTKRIIHALEIYMMTQKPFSSFHKQTKKERSFRIVKVGLTRERAELYDCINRRVDEMMLAGLENEARELLPYRNENALDTVGYKELFKYFDGEWSKVFAVEKIKQNTRNYAKKQLAWFKKDKTIKWFHPSDFQGIIEYLTQTQGL